MKIGYLLTVVIFFSSLTLNAQTHRVSGKVADTSGMPVSALSVTIISGADTLKKATDVYGAFRFDNVTASGFTVRVTGIGYKKFEKKYQFGDNDRSINLPMIEMQRDYSQLQDVVITPPPIVLKEDTVEYKADSFKTKPGAVVEDLLKKLPGVQVDKSGNITAQGKQVTKVKVNGKDFFGNDPQTATKNLPADIVDKVQVVDDYGDQANFNGMKTGDADKVINLQLKKDKSEGYFAKLTGGAGTEERYMASATGNYFNKDKQVSLFANSNNTNTGLFSFNANRGMGNMMRAGQSMMNDFGGMGALNTVMNNGDFGLLGNGNSNSGVNTQTSIGVNYSDQLGKKATLYGSYVFADNNNFSNTITSQQRIFSDSSIFYKDQTISSNKNQSNRIYMNLEYKIDSFTSLKISPSLLANHGSSNSSSANQTTLQDLSIINSNNQLNSGTNVSNSFNGNAILRKRFRKAGRTFSANFTYGVNDSRSDNDIYSTPVYYKPSVLRDTSDQLNKTRSNGYNYGVNLSYTEPVDKEHLFEFIYRYSRTYSKSIQQNEFTDPPIILPPGGTALLNNELDNDFVTNTFGTNFRTTKKKYNYTLGLSVQPVDMKSYDYNKSSSYIVPTRWNVIPIVNLNYQFSRSKRLSFFYRGTPRQPQISQLQPVVDLSNSTNITTGNPNLSSEFNNVVTVNYNNFNFISGKLLFANISFTQTNNKIVTDSKYEGARQVSTYANAEGFYNLTGFYTYSKPFKNRRYIITFTGTANYNNNISLTDSKKNIGRNWYLTQRFNFEFNYKEWLEWGLGAGYNYNTSKFTLTPNSNFSTDAWVLSSNARIDIPGGWVLNYDLDYTINNGLSQGVNANTAILNAYIEKQFLKKKTLTLRASGFDLLKQNTNVNRSVSYNTITDTRNNLLTQYFMFTASFRFSKFKGSNPNQNRNALPARMF